MEQQQTKSFLARWKEGMQQITPLQQLEASQKGNWVMVVGLIAGIIVMLFRLKDFWWVELILAASLFNQSVTMLGIWQKIKMIKKFEVEANEFNNQINLQEEKEECLKI